MYSSKRRRKAKETIQKKYNVTNITSAPEIQEKIKQTLKRRYGVEHPMQSEEIKKRARQTSLENWGYDSPSKSEIVKATRCKNNKEKYGYEFTLQVPQIRQRIKQTNLKKYGVSYITQVPEFNKKRMETMFRNGTVCTSRPQRNIYDVLIGANYNVALNYPIKNCFLDIAFLDIYCFCEYDGSGHDLDVKMGHITEEEFQQKETKRSYMLRNAGWKEIRIISSNDKFPDNNTLLNMINLAKEYLLNTDHTWIHINLDKQCFIFTKEHITISFDSLKTIL